jgi:hypothetical protein
MMKGVQKRIRWKEARRNRWKAARAFAEQKEAPSLAGVRSAGGMWRWRSSRAASSAGSGPRRHARTVAYGTRTSNCEWTRPRPIFFSGKSAESLDRPRQVRSRPLAIARIDSTISRSVAPGPNAWAAPISTSFLLSPGVITDPPTTTGMVTPLCRSSSRISGT